MVDYIEEQCRNFKQEHNIKFVIIDYLQLINNKDVEIIGTKLKALTEDLGITILMLSQLAGTDKMPTLTDLKESKAIADVSDVVLFLYRENTNKDVEVIVAKNNGGTNDNLKEIQDLLDRAKSYRAALSKPALGSSIKDLKLDDVTNEIPVNEKDNIYIKCSITKKEAITGCTKTIKTKNKRIQVRIPAGIVEGQKLILKGAGNGYSDLIVKVIIK